MTTTPVTGARDVAVRIDFSSGGETFATETFNLSIADRENADTVTTKLAQDSAYYNERIPDLAFSVVLTPVEPDDGPDGKPPSGGAMLPKCGKCGDAAVNRDATARWSIDDQRWELSTIFDFETCENCGTEGDDIAVWVPIEHARPADYLRTVAAKLGKPDLVEDPSFQRVMSDFHGARTVDEAIQAWRPDESPSA